jgi:hypothetical protein
MLWKVSLAGVFLLPAIAVAQPIQGLYIGAEVGANFAGTLSASQQTTKVYTDPGPSASSRSAGASATACAPRSKAVIGRTV